MNPIHEIVSSNMKRIREERKLSLDQLAKMTDVSKSMLSQIERGTVVPTISTIWKITNGLKLSFTELVQQSETTVKVIHCADLDPLIENDGKYRNFPVFPFDEKRKFEMYYIELDEGAYLAAEPHPAGAAEYIVVFSGELRVCVDEEEYTVGCGSAIRFHGDRPHSYECLGSDQCRISMVIAYD